MTTSTGAGDENRRVMHSTPRQPKPMPDVFLSNPDPTPLVEWSLGPDTEEPTTPTNPLLGTIGDRRLVLVSMFFDGIQTEDFEPLGIEVGTCPPAEGRPGRRYLLLPSGWDVVASVGNEWEVLDDRGLLRAVVATDPMWDFRLINVGHHAVMAIVYNGADQEKKLDKLTPTELRYAEIAAQGLRNEVHYGPHLRPVYERRLYDLVAEFDRRRALADVEHDRQASAAATAAFDRRRAAGEL